MNTDLKRPIGFDETGFDGQEDSTDRIQGWDFLMAGGSLYSHLDFSFSVGHEDGTFAYPSKVPGGGSASLRKQLSHLSELFRRIPDLTAMQPANEILPAELPPGVSVRALGAPGSYYLLYAHHGRLEGEPKKRWILDEQPHTLSLECRFPAGEWRVTWLDPKTGRTLRKQTQSSSGELPLRSPAYSEGIAAIVERRIHRLQQRRLEGSLLVQSGH